MTVLGLSETEWAAIKDEVGRWEAFKLPRGVIAIVDRRDPQAA